MGQFLVLLPFDTDSQFCKSSSMLLECEQDAGLFDAIEGYAQESVPEPFNTYLGQPNKGHPRNEHFGNTQKSRFGDPLMCMPVECLLELVSHNGVKRSEHNRAIWAYLRKLSGKTKVALYWR